MAVAGISAALRVTKQKIGDQSFLFLGAGSAGTGIAELISQAMAQGRPDDRCGAQTQRVVRHQRPDRDLRTDLADFQKPFAHRHAPLKSFVDAVEALKPTGIIGVSTVPKLFDQSVIEAMAEINERPIIFPYSNPTSRSECTAEEAYNGRMAARSSRAAAPSRPSRSAGKKFIPGQGNNVYIFPALGMAVYATQATRVTDEMFLFAAKASPSR